MSQPNSPSQTGIGGGVLRAPGSKRNLLKCAANSVIAAGRWSKVPKLSELQRRNAEYEELRQQRREEDQQYDRQRKQMAENLKGLEITRSKALVGESLGDDSQVIDPQELACIIRELEAQIAQLDELHQSKKETLSTKMAAIELTHDEKTQLRISEHASKEQEKEEEFAAAALPSTPSPALEGPRRGRERASSVRRRSLPNLAPDTESAGNLRTHSGRLSQPSGPLAAAAAAKVEQQKELERQLAELRREHERTHKGHQEKIRELNVRRSKALVAAQLGDTVSRVGEGGSDADELTALCKEMEAIMAEEDARFQTRQEELQQGVANCQLTPEEQAAYRTDMAHRRLSLPNQGAPLRRLPSAGHIAHSGGETPPPEQVPRRRSSADAVPRVRSKQGHPAGGPAGGPAAGPGSANASPVHSPSEANPLTDLHRLASSLHRRDQAKLGAVRVPRFAMAAHAVAAASRMRNAVSPPPSEITVVVAPPGDAPADQPASGSTPPASAGGTPPPKGDAPPQGARRAGPEAAAAVMRWSRPAARVMRWSRPAKVDGEPTPILIPIGTAAMPVAADGRYYAAATLGRRNPLGYISGPCSLPPLRAPRRAQSRSPSPRGGGGARRLRKRPAAAPRPLRPL